MNELKELATKTAKDVLIFIQTSAPDLFHQWMIWNFWSSIAGMAIFIILIAVIGFFINKSKMNKWWIVEDSEGLIIIVWGFFIIIGLGGFFINLATAIEITIAPKLWILEHIKNLIK